MISLWIMDIDQLPVGRIAELVEYCTSVVEVRVWVPIQTSIIRKGIAYCSSGELVPLIHSEQLNFRPAITTVLWKWDTIKTVIIHNMIIVLITVIGSCVMITKHTNTIIRVASFHWLLCMLIKFLGCKAVQFALFCWKASDAPAVHWDAILIGVASTGLSVFCALIGWKATVLVCCNSAILNVREIFHMLCVNNNCAWPLKPKNPWEAPCLSRHSLWLVNNRWYKQTKPW